MTHDITFQRYITHAHTWNAEYAQTRKREILSGENARTGGTSMHLWYFISSKQRCASAPEESFRSAISNVGKLFILESTDLLQIMCMFVYIYRMKIYDWRWRRITFLYPILLLTQQEIHPISTTCSQQHIFNQKSSPINLPHWQNLGSSLDGSCCLHSVSPHDSAEISPVRCVLRNAFKFAKSFVSIWTTPRRGVELSTAGKEDDGAHGAQVEAQGKIGTFPTNWSLTIEPQ